MTASSAQRRARRAHWPTGRQGAGERERDDSLTAQSDEPTPSVHDVAQKRAGAATSCEPQLRGQIRSATMNRLLYV
jgi:hypothetical protein